ETSNGSQTYMLGTDARIMARNGSTDFSSIPTGDQVRLQLPPASRRAPGSAPGGLRRMGVPHDDRDHGLDRLLVRRGDHERREPPAPAHRQSLSALRGGGPRDDRPGARPTDPQAASGLTVVTTETHPRASDSSRAALVAWERGLLGAGGLATALSGP